MFSKLKGKSVPIVGRGSRKVLIAVPVYDKPEVDTVIALFNLMTTTKHSHQLRFKTSSLVHRARGTFVDQALEGGFDYLLFVDGDMVFPHDALDRLVDRNVDVVGALCTQRQPPCLPTIGMLDRDANGNITRVQTILSYPEDGMLEVDSIGMAFTLISRKALEAVKQSSGRANPFRFEPLPNGGELPEDSAFCWRAKVAGLKVWCDTGLSILHKGSYLYGEQEFLANFQKDLIARNGQEAQGRGGNEPVTP